VDESRDRTGDEEATEIVALKLCSDIRKTSAALHGVHQVDVTAGARNFPGKPIFKHTDICSCLHLACPKRNATQRCGSVSDNASPFCTPDDRSIQNVSKQSTVPTDHGLVNYKILTSTMPSTSATSSLSLAAHADTNSLSRLLRQSLKGSYH
jgi:hypothetical protein